MIDQPPAYVVRAPRTIESAEFQIAELRQPDNAKGQVDYEYDGYGCAYTHRCAMLGYSAPQVTITDCFWKLHAVECTLNLQSPTNQGYVLTVLVTRAQVWVVFR